MDTIDFESDSFSDVVAKDDRYDARAYALLMDVVHYLSENGHHSTGTEVLDEFRERTIDQYGPLAYTVLTEWGVKSCQDVGEMMANLVEFKRVCKDEDDDMTSFLGGYDFEETFLDPYKA